MSRGSVRRRPIGGIAALAGLIAGFLAVMVSQPVEADVPTPTGNPLWTQGEAGTYKWGDGVKENGDPQPMPSWVATVMTGVMEVGWADPETNNSDTVRYSYSTTNDVIVRYSTESIAACEAVAGWLGCADASGGTYKIWIRSNPSATWCDKLSQPVTGCPRRRPSSNP